MYFMGADGPGPNVNEYTHRENNSAEGENNENSRVVLSLSELFNFQIAYDKICICKVLKMLSSSYIILRIQRLEDK